jgi:hypothetical protein
MAATAAAERARGMEPACAAAPAAAAARAATVPVAREPTVARREGSMVAAGGRNLVFFVCAGVGLGQSVGLGRDGPISRRPGASPPPACRWEVVEGCVDAGLRGSARRLT